MICTNSQENYDILNYCVLNVTVCERCLRSSTVSSVSLFHYFHVQPWTDTMYFEWFSLTLTLLPWCHDLFFVLYVFALYYIVCMYPLYTTCALLLLSIVWLKYVFPCVLLVDNYVSLNQCDLNFHFFWNVTLMICMVKLTCSFDFIDFYTWPWFVLMIFMISTKYGHWLSTDDGFFLCEVNYSSLQVMSLSRVKVLEFVWG